jgi:hypothetical protein
VITLTIIVTLIPTLSPTLTLALTLTKDITQAISLEGRCPEWPQSEVIALLVLDLKIAGFVAVVSIIYLLGALVVGLLIRSNLKDYKSDYI